MRLESKLKRLGVFQQQEVLLKLGGWYEITHICATFPGRNDSDKQFLRRLYPGAPRLTAEISSSLTDRAISQVRSCERACDFTTATRLDPSKYLVREALV